MILPRVKKLSASMVRALQSSSATVSFETLASLQMSSAAVSLAGSLAMAFMIITTGKRLSTPYRRIIFGLSLADILTSTVLLVGPLVLPSDIPNSWGMGNEGTCVSSAFIMHFGFLLLPMYTCFLCWYYLCKLKYHMTNETFARKMEWKIHIFCVLLALTITIVATALDTFHPNAYRTTCQLAVTPFGCRVFPDLVGECDPTIEARTNIITIVNHSLRIFWLLCMIVIMGMLYHHVITTNRLHSDQSHLKDSQIQFGTGDEEDSSGAESSGVHAHTNNSSQQQSVDRSRPQENLNYLATLYRNETAIQGTLYFLVYCMTYFPSIVMYALVILRKPVPKLCQFLAFFLTPFSGFFTVLVYTRPQIAHLRRLNPNQSRLKCFWLVVKAGGEVPEEPNNDHGLGLRQGLRKKKQKDPALGGESISSVQIGAIMSNSRGILYPSDPLDESESNRVSSVDVVDGQSLSLQEDDWNFNPESQWSYVKGGSMAPRGGRNSENNESLPALESGFSVAPPESVGDDSSAGNNDVHLSMDLGSSVGNDVHHSMD